MPLLFSVEERNAPDLLQVRLNGIATVSCDEILLMDADEVGVPTFGPVGSTFIVPRLTGSCARSSFFTVLKRHMAVSRGGVYTWPLERIRLTLERRNVGMPHHRLMGGRRGQHRNVPWR